MKELTIDIREMFKKGLKESDLSDFLQNYQDQGYEVNQIYCTDPQRETIKSFTKKITDAKTKKVLEVQKYAGITLTVE